MTAYHYLRPPDVAMVGEDSDGGTLTIYVAPLPDGPIRVLTGAAAVIWQVATQGPDSDDEMTASVAGRVARLVAEDQADIEPHVDSFLAELVAAGLLEPATG